MNVANVMLEEAWGELLRSTADNEAIIRGLLACRPEIEKVKNLNYMFMNYLSIIQNIFTTKMGGGWIDPRVRIPSDLDFIEMLKLLVRYTNDITTWVEDHDQRGVPWEYIDDFNAESLFQVDMQCQRWWLLADMTIFGRDIGAFTMPPPLSPVEESPSQLGKSEAPRTPAMSFTEHESPYTASISSSYPSAAASFNEHQMEDGFPSSWNDVAEPRFTSHCIPLGDFDQRFSDNGRNEHRGSVMQQPTLSMPSTPRLEQQGFVPSPNPSLRFQTPANKQNAFFQPMTPPRKIAIPRLQKQGAFEPLLPPTQHSILRSTPAIAQASSPGTPKKRRYTKVSAEILSERRRKRQAIGGETPKQKPVSTEHEVFTPDSAFSPSILGNVSPASALGFPGESYKTNESILSGFDYVNNNAAIPRTILNRNSSVFNPNETAITSQTDWDDKLPITINSYQGAVNTGLGIYSPAMDCDFTKFEELAPGPCMEMNMNMGQKGTDIVIHNETPFDLPMHSSPTTRSDSNGTGLQMPREMYKNSVEWKMF